MQRCFNLVVSGAVTGAIYSMMAAGLVLTHQTSGIFNFGHGAIAFSVAYVYFQLNTGQEMHWIPALILSVLVFAPLLGVLLDRILLRRLAAAPVYARIVGTIGLVVALPALLQWLVEEFANVVFDLGLPTAAQAQETGAAPGVGPYPRAVFHPFDVVINSDQIAAFVAAALSAAALWYVLRRTRLGLSMRAVVDRRELAALRGVSEARTSRAAWVLSMILAGLGGVLITPLFTLADYALTSVVFASLAAVALAGLRSIPIAVLGGLALGVLQNLVAGYSDDLLPSFLSELSGLKSSIPYVLTLVLLFAYARVGQGRVAGTVADEHPPPDHRAGLPAWRRRLPWAVFTVLLVGFSLQWFGAAWAQADAYEVGRVARGIAIAIVFLSFVIVTGIGGMVSLAQATFFTAGGFAAGWAVQYDWGIDAPFIASNGQLNFVLALVVAAVVAAALGAIVAIPVRRLGALAVALGTFALVFCADFIAFDYEPIGQGSIGWFIRAPTLDIPVLNDIGDLLMKGPQDRLDFSQPQAQVLMLLVIFGAIALLIHCLHRSATGRAMLAVRSSEVAARTSGISATKQKIAIFALSAAIAGVGGALYGMTSFSITSTTAPPLLGLVWLAVAVTFGVRRPGGALLAGLAFTCSQTFFSWLGRDVIGGAGNEVLASAHFAPILFGLGAINLAKNPDGLLAMIGHERLKKKLAKQRKEHIARAEAEVTHSGVTADASPTEPAFAVPSDAALVLDDVVAGYGEVEVLHGVSVAVRPGEIVALLGANGAGKSTLCSVAAGSLAPTRGKVLLEGVDVTDQAADRRARDGMLLVPEARGIFPGLTVDENLRVLLRTPEELEAAQARFPILSERRGQLAGLLSGGEQQMLSLAPALAQPPKVFIADEPTLGLAPMSAAVVIEAIDALRSLGCAVLLVEEKASEVMQLADTIMFMELGRVVWMGPRHEADIRQLAAAYLGASALTAGLPTG
jgi:ABC-type branched-subunit amino acid transport system ATPase component/branched-subunit amino acid ABC-type transport system permease component